MKRALITIATASLGAVLFHAVTVYATTPATATSAFANEYQYFLTRKAMTTIHACTITCDTTKQELTCGYDTTRNAVVIANTEGTTQLKWGNTNINAADATTYGTLGPGLSRAMNVTENAKIYCKLSSGTAVISVEETVP